MWRSSKQSTDSGDQAKEQHWVLEETENPTPDISWTGRPTKINLYSENIVDEGDTTEAVNRESIRDLSSTRQQWESILSPIGDKQETNKKQTSSTVRHWEVNFPNKRKSLNVEIQQSEIDSSVTQMADTDTQSHESAIEREIRMNMEREANLRREQEERKELMERQKGKVDTTLYENVPKEETKPTFHELTEADRGSELWKRESIIQQELREQEEKEKALRKNLQWGNNRQQEQQSNGQAEETTESIIEREIRIQREREAELHQQRQGKSVSSQQEASAPEPEPESKGEPQASRISAEAKNDINHNQTKTVSYETAISGFQHEGESRIARELREAREREEELQRQRERLNQVSVSETPTIPSTPSTPQQQQQPYQATKTTPRVTNVSPASRQGTWQKDVSPFLQKSKRSESVDSLTSSHSTGKTPSDTGTPYQDDDDFKEYRPKSETPIEREIRLARERENELRRAKGLPEIPEPKVEHSGPPTTPVSSNDTPRYMRSYMDSSNTMKRYSSSRLQQEIIKQKERELDLRKEGKIITTSEEHIEPLKYVAVTGQETANATVKRNFVTRKSSSGLMPSKGDDVDGGASVDNSTPKTTPKAELLKNRKVVSSGGAGFSYKESRNTAESKIERELREMREREDELRKQRMSLGAESSNAGEETPNGKI